MGNHEHTPSVGFGLAAFFGRNSGGDPYTAAKQCAEKHEHSYMSIEEDGYAVYVCPPELFEAIQVIRTKRQNPRWSPSALKAWREARINRAVDLHTYPELAQEQW